MSRRTAGFVSLLVVAVALAAAACAESTGPSSHVSADQTCDWQSNGTCLH
jgi:hypothetical protein